MLESRLGPLVRQHGLGAGNAGALFVITKPFTRAGIRTQSLEPTILDNLHEVFNIFGQVFPGRMLDTVTLREVNPLAELSPVATALLSKPAKQVDLELSIDGYGDGNCRYIPAHVLASHFPIAAQAACIAC